MPETSDHNVKIVDQHTQQAAGYAQLTQSLSGQKPSQRHEVIGARPDDILLDIACGTGSLTLELAPHVAHAIGFDITPAMLDQARSAQQTKDVSNVVWIQGDAAALPFADGAFSLVTGSSAFHHFETPVDILKEMARVCRPGGRIAVSDVTPDADKTSAYDRMEKMRDPSHGHAHSVPELVELGRRFNLTDPVIETSMTGPIPYEAVLATSFPETHSREELLELMRQDAEAGEDSLGFRAQTGDGTVLVTYPVSTLVWIRH
jgi:ubiquinone/menaquinone biosynthesis C-methylase UbiE